jgi:hypothetical protein
MLPIPCANAPIPASLFVRLRANLRAVSGSRLLFEISLPQPSRFQVPLVQQQHARLSYVAPHAVSPSLSHTWPSSHLLLTDSGSLWDESLARRLSRNPARRKPVTFTRNSSASFATSSSRRATKAIFNPQSDNEGKEMTLEITPRAGKVHWFSAPTGLHLHHSVAANGPLFFSSVFLKSWPKIPTPASHSAFKLKAAAAMASSML